MNTWRHDLRDLLELARTQVRLARIVGVQEPSITQWLSGTRPNAATRETLARLHIEALYRLAWLNNYLLNSKAENIIVDTYGAGGIYGGRELESRKRHYVGNSAPLLGKVVTTIVVDTLSMSCAMSGDFAIFFQPVEDTSRLHLVTVYPDLQTVKTASQGRWQEPLAHGLSPIKGDTSE